MMVERPRCPACDTPPSHPLVEVPFEAPAMRNYLATYYGGRVDASMLTGGAYRLERCAACGLGWQRWVLDDAGMNALYGTWIASDTSSKKRKIASLPVQYARHFARLLRIFPDPSSTLLLDYGMGWGEWCHMAQSFGFNVHGVELSTERVDAARAKGIAASLPKDMPAGPYDFLYLEQVLEHVPNPRELLENLIGKLRPGGYVHIGVPDGAALLKGATASRVLRKGPAQPLEHINVFTNASLKSLLRSLGCSPAPQREGLIRTTGAKAFVTDLALAAARHLPASLFPPGTSLMFRKD